MRTTRLTVLFALAVTALFASVAAAQGATVVNGGFETGTLEGWQTAKQTEEGEWSVASGTEGPISNFPVPAPFEGTYDALADEGGPSSMVLYQEVALAAGETHKLSLELSYHSYAPIAIPSPDTLSVYGSQEGEEEEEYAQPNQQVRVDVLKAGSSPYSLASGDILATVFATAEGDAEEMDWTTLNADLSAFAGQTVMIRVASVDNSLYLDVGVDAVKIVSSPIARTTTTTTTTTVAPYCTMPKLKGKSLVAARKALIAADCSLGKGKVRRKKGVAAKNGKVIRQWPKPGTLRAAGAVTAIKLG